VNADFLKDDNVKGSLIVDTKKLESKVDAINLLATLLIEVLLCIIAHRGVISTSAKPLLVVTSAQMDSIRAR
jgi:hypothetical protein